MKSIKLRLSAVGAEHAHRCRSGVLSYDTTDRTRCPGYFHGLFFPVSG